MKAAVYILAVLLLISVGLNVWLEHKRGKADADANLWFLMACQANTENGRLGKALNNRQQMETFMQTQTDAYLAILDAFNAVAPDMPLGNVPADPELQRLCVLYHNVNGEPWDGDAKKLREWAKRFDTSIPDKLPEPASRRVIDAAGGPE